MLRQQSLQGGFPLRPDIVAGAVFPDYEDLSPTSAEIPSLLISCRNARAKNWKPHSPPLE